MNHNHHLIWFAALLSLSPSSAMFSVDEILSRRNGLPEIQTIANPQAYKCPLQIAWILIALIYFFPGIWKLLASAGTWTSIDNLTLLLYHRWFELDDLSRLFRIDNYPLLLQSLGLWTLFFELTFIFFIFNNTLRKFAVVQGLFFHFGTFLTMRISFYTLLVCYVVFIDWARLLGYRSSECPERNQIQRKMETAPWNGWRKRVFYLLASVIVFANVVTGCFGIDSWPFAVYPRFSKQYNSEFYMIEIEAYTALDKKIPLNHKEVSRKYLPPRLQLLRMKIASQVDKAKQYKMAKAYTKLILQQSKNLDQVDHVKVFRGIYSIYPQDRSKNPLSLEEIFQFKL